MGGALLSTELPPQCCMVSNATRARSIPVNGRVDVVAFGVGCRARHSVTCAYPSPDVRDPEDPAIPAWMFGSLCRSALIATNELPFKMCFLLALRGCLDGRWAKSRTCDAASPQRLETRSTLNGQAFEQRCSGLEEASRLERLCTGESHWLGTVSGSLLHRSVRSLRSARTDQDELIYLVSS
jgi:hypothetical protein